MDVGSENLLAMNIVDFRVRFAISYDNPSYTPGANIPKKKIAYVPPGVGFAVGKKIIVESPCIPMLREAEESRLCRLRSKTELSRTLIFQ